MLLAAYDMPDGDTRTVATARWTLAKPCMARLGFTGLKHLATDPAPAWPQRPAQAGVYAAVLYASDDFRYGVQDPKQAARYGYQAVRFEEERRHPQRKWTLAEYLALTGEFCGNDPRTVHGHRIPRRGCLGAAERTIYGIDPLDHKDPVWDLKTKSLQQGMREPGWKRADRAWSACMRDAGYHYATPGDAETGDDRRRQELTERLTGARHDGDRPTPRGGHPARPAPRVRVGGGPRTSSTGP
ncbi:hypothetical protein [Streptomyces sp. NPDC001307]|uniref:hypothetical protein n=1 Tax=Streptomyces sp. NPDC001307 TaxID=3364560 RepID=UPI0036C5E81D